MKSDEDINLKRLRILGFIKGKTIKIITKAPLGDPFLVELGDITLILSKSLIKKLNLVPCGEDIYKIT